MELPKISIEQQTIIRSLENSNIIVDSVAGSGKTTTNLYIAKHYIDKNILLLTYNTRLKIETRDKAKSLGINNLETHSYHSVCVKYYNKRCFTDTIIEDIINKNTKCGPPINYNIILLDEAQDITDLYHALICKINKDNTQNAKICLLGDMYQSINTYKKADARYMNYADQLYAHNQLDYERHSLSTSFRVTDKIANFVNECMLNLNRIHTVKESNYKPKYIICDIFPDKYDITNYKPYIEIQNFLNSGYNVDDIFVLAASLKSSSTPVKLFENYLALNNIPVYASSNDDEKLDSDIIANKIVFATFHQVKGLERKIVIVFGFDKSYFTYYKRIDNESQLICPNELYVATTRAKEHLVLLHHHSNDYLPFLNQSKLEECAIIDGNLSSRRELYAGGINYEISVTNIIRHLPYNVIDKCIDYLEIRSIRKQERKISIPHKNKNKDLCESISDINGIAIPAYLEYTVKKEMTILNNCINPVISISSAPNNKPLKIFWKTHLDKLNSIRESQSIEENLAYIATIYSSLIGQYISRSCQMVDFTWLTNNILSQCMERMNSLQIARDAKFEDAADVYNKPELLNRTLNGIYDCIDDNYLYEFKCTEKIEKTHYLQLALYMYINEMNIEKMDKRIEYDLIQNGLDNINSNNKIRYKLDKKIGIGIVIKQFKNGNINVKDIDTLKKYRVKKDNIINNISYEENKDNLIEIKHPRYLIYNILTDQLDEIVCDITKLRKMVALLFNEKYTHINDATDNEFIANAISISNKYKH